MSFEATVYAHKRHPDYTLWRKRVSQHLFEREHRRTLRYEYGLLEADLIRQDIFKTFLAQPDRYQHPETQIAWLAWKSARCENPYQTPFPGDPLEEDIT